MEGAFSCYSNFDTKVCTDMAGNDSIGDAAKQILKTQYQILFRQWGKLYEQWENIDESRLRQLLQKKAMQPVLDKEAAVQSDKIDWKQAKLANLDGIETDLRLIDLLRWNIGYFRKAFSEKETEKQGTTCNTESATGDSTNVLELISRCFDLDSKFEISYYTDPIYGVDKNPNILELFFCGEQPLLDVRYDPAYPVQERASEKLQEPDCPYHLLFDEVGTGKTVSALYCMRDVIDRKKNEAKILIVCPNHKVDEWKSDIQRQMGLYVHYVDSTIKEEYEGNIKYSYFKEKEPLLFLERQKSSQMNDGCNQWAENHKWDLIVIDEGHLCFDNYDELRAEKAVLLTATPIVINASHGIRTLNEYKTKLAAITRTYGGNVTLQNLFTESDIFTQNFREDLGIKPKKRKIVFLECERWELRENYLDILEGIFGKLARLQCEQDDELLIEEIYEKYRDKIINKGYLLGEKAVLPNGKNGKYETLSKFLCGHMQKSYILFFTRTWTADLIYRKLIADDRIQRDNLVIAIKHGKRLDMYPKADRELQDNMLGYMQVGIKNGKRVLFLTTGGTGGTGLNLGRFDGVINYELPFTCVELEQRFGRVDRMDVAEKQEKEMVFILNNDSNHMLRYSTTKIVETCKYVPVRNTVLFYPEIVKKILDTLRDDLNQIRCSQEELSVWDELQEKRRMVEEAGKKDWLSEIWRKWNKNKDWRNREELYDLDLSQNGFIKYLTDKNEELCCISRKLNSLEDLEQDTKKWCGLLGVKEEIAQDELSFGLSQEELEKMQETDKLEGTNDRKDEDGLELEAESYKRENGIVLLDPGNAKKQNEDIWERNREDIESDFERLDQSIRELENQSLKEGHISTGLFYIKDVGDGRQTYVRQTVEEFRKNF